MLTHSSSSQSQMAASTRMGLISGKAPKKASRQPDSHVTLPGYVWSNSEQDCLPQLIHEETKESGGRQGDEILMEEARPDSTGDSGMQPRDPCLPLRVLLGPGHTPR